MKNIPMLKKIFLVALLSAFFLASTTATYASWRNEEKRKKEVERTQEQFRWWPTDAMPQPVKDQERGGYWWWPVTPGQMKPWGNRGYIYVYKIIFDYKAEELPPPKPQELRPSLVIKNILKNVKIYFDYNKADLRGDAIPVLDSAVKALGKNPSASILITGNADVRGSENYNIKLGQRRAASVKDYMLQHGIAEERIKIVSRGKLDAVAPVTDLVGMQKDRNAQFMVAEVEEVMIPYPGTGEAEKMGAKPTEEQGKYIVQEQQQVETAVQVSTKEYTIQKGDSLSKIAQKELGGAHRWKYLYELNKDRIKDPNKLKVGQVIIIPVE